MNPVRGFTLIEVLAALLILSLLGLMSYRGLAGMLDTRAHVRLETEKWRNVSAFFERFEQDVALAAPRPARTATGTAPPWRGQPRDQDGPQIEFSRLAPAEHADVARRLGYRLNDQGQIELWLWPALDSVAAPTRYPVLDAVAVFEVHYLDASQNWTVHWPAPGTATMPLPRAVRLQLVLASGENIVRVFALAS